MIRRWVCVALLAASCVPTTKVNGFALERAAWSNDEALLKRQAGFDLSCAESKLGLTVVSADSAHATSVTAEGCARRARYVRVETATEIKWNRKN